jgi:hypothetical protein
MCKEAILQLHYLARTPVKLRANIQVEVLVAALLPRDRLMEVTDCDAALVVFSL